MRPRKRDGKNLRKFREKAVQHEHHVGKMKKKRPAAKKNVPPPNPPETPAPRRKRFQSASVRRKKEAQEVDGIRGSNISSQKKGLQERGGGRRGIAETRDHLQGKSWKACIRKGGMIPRLLSPGGIKGIPYGLPQRKATTI